MPKKETTNALTSANPNKKTNAFLVKSENSYHNWAIYEAEMKAAT